MEESSEDEMARNLPRKTGGNKVKYSDIYLQKKRKTESRSFWRSYKQRASAFILGTAFVTASMFLLHRLYEQYTNTAGHQIVQKLALNKKDRQRLDNIAQRVAAEYLIPQFNQPVAVDRNLSTNFKYADRPFSAIIAGLSDIIYHPPRTAWHLCEGIAGAGTSSTMKAAYNHVIGDIEDVLSGTSDKYRAETVQHKSFLYLNFKELFDSTRFRQESARDHREDNALRNLERNLRTCYGLSGRNSDGQWLLNEDTLPESMDEFDVLRRALLIAIQQRFQDLSRKQQPIILVVDSMDELMFKDNDFKYWIMLLGGAVQQRMASIVSVSSNSFGNKIILDTLSRTYGNIANPLSLIADGSSSGEGTVLKTVEFLSREQVLETVMRNMDIGDDSGTAAEVIYAVTRGYPLLTSAIIEGLNSRQLSVRDVEGRGDTFRSWFDGWYEGEYLVKCAVPQFKLMVSRMRKTEIASKGEIKKLVKQIQSTLTGDVGIEEKLKGIHREMGKKGNATNAVQLISDETLSLIGDYMERLAALEGCKIILWPDWLCRDNDIHGQTLPLVQSYWDRHSADHIADIILDNFDVDLTGSKLVGLS